MTTHPVPSDTVTTCDVVILGGGLAALSLARHLLLDTDKTVLLLERRPEIPPDRQKVGESLVQVGGYYFSKVLDLEEHLLHEHLMKYNLRFYWKTPGRSHDGFEDYGHLAIRPFSNIASYQLDRNVFEAELLRLNREHPRFAYHTAATQLQVDLADEGSTPEGHGAQGDHRIEFTVDGQPHAVTSRWVVDATGRGRFLAKRHGLRRPSTIEHGAFFWWVDGTVDIEKLTDRSRRERRLDPSRGAVGHLPLWLATNHFMGEGFWFWVIPLQGKTSLGIVFDNQLLEPGEVFSVEKATEWICREFPLFARDLPQREVLDFGGFRSFSHDCAQTIDKGRWAMTGEAGRFTDPLYSPGSDLIAIHNTLIVDAIRSDDTELAAKCQIYEPLMRSVYTAYVPAYATSYDALGDQEVFTLKYGWELTIYFAYYVFPFINDLLTERRFLLSYLRLFGRIGPMNRNIQRFLSEYFQWKKATGKLGLAADPQHIDLMSIDPLKKAETTFYAVGVDVAEARRVLEEQLTHIEELARWTMAHTAAQVTGDPRALTARAFVEGLDVCEGTFDPEAFAGALDALPADAASDPWPWTLDPDALARHCAPLGSSELESTDGVAEVQVEAAAAGG